MRSRAGARSEGAQGKRRSRGCAEFIHTILWRGRNALKYEAFKALAKNAAKEDILKLLGIIDKTDNPKIADYVSAVLHVSISVNEELFEEIKGAGTMTEAIERVFKKEIDEKKTEGKEEMVTEMLRGNEPVEKILVTAQSCHF